MSAPPPHLAPLLEVSERLRARELSPVEVTRAMLERVEALNPALGAYYTVFADEALAAAAEAEREIADGAWRGPLHGVPIAFKDIYALGPTTAGSRLLREHRPTAPAWAVRRAREAGAVILGKLATHEFALAAATLTDAFPPARNPWSRDRSPGGSSTGAGVAVAAGLAYGAFGTDTGGSVRMPAAHCGVVGFKPTFGLIGRTGIVPLAWSLDHAGPLARTVADAAALFLAVRGHDEDDPASSPRQPAVEPADLERGVKGLRVGVPRDYWAARCTPGVAARVDAALRRLAELGAEVTDVSLGFPFDRVIAIAYLITMSEMAAYHLPDLRARADLYGREFRLVLAAGELLPAQAYVDAQRARRRIAAAVMGLLADHDVLAMPAVGAPADVLPAGPQPVHVRISATPPLAYTWLANLYGGPAISVPCGFAGEPPLPVGLQLLGRPYGDATVLRAARAYELAESWRDRHPPDPPAIARGEADPLT